MTRRIAVGAVVFRGDAVLLIRRARPPGEGFFTLPGGHHEPGETFAHALVREVREETGLVVRAGPLVEVVPLEGADVEYALIDYVAYEEGGRLQAGDDALEACFVPLADLAGVDLTDAVRRVVAAARARAPLS